MDHSTQDAVAPEKNPPNNLNKSDMDMLEWNSVFGSLELSMFVNQVFSEFEFISMQNDVLKLKKSDDMINPTDSLKTEFIEALSSHFGSKIALEIESGDITLSPAAAQENAVKDQLNKDKNALLENPAIQDIISSFDGKIVDESIKKINQ